ncbi:hypothetical protein VKT23_001809 [Stygiomarasmius scandens]|uniref:GH16 domain-containing protein n=1 Tax=Marasmiellus scandens TaxID=2682957 RepID=A0ABR1K1C4_9AGAR
MSYQHDSRAGSSSSLLRNSATDHSGSPYSSVPGSARSSRVGAISGQYLPPDPRHWGSNISPLISEADDDLHDPRRPDKFSHPFAGRALANLGCLLILMSALLMLFIGYPILTYVQKYQAEQHGLNAALGVNASGQVPSLGNWGLIDLDTPDDAYTTKSLRDGSEWQLIFSDEFNVDGRTFYPGDDPFWEALDLHYWATNNMEWYDPAAITTKDGSLVITLSQKETHGMQYQGGMMSTWNKFCFTGGMIQVSVQLPGINNVVGLWPAVWAMGNLGRAGYGATLDGMWPYTYDACDVGAAPNQTVNGLPAAAAQDGPADSNFALSYLPGQRLSRCTCPGESHPGPKHKDGSFVGRGAPEIDVLEAQVSNEEGQVSQSAQWAPFNDKYVWKNTSDNLIINDESISSLNTYIGGSTQQATSVVTTTNQHCYELAASPCFSTYGFEYKPGFDNAYISWMSDSKQAWTINADGVSADSAVEISARPVPQEPMYLLINLGMSKNFGEVDLAHLTFPARMSVDWIRVYQDPKAINVGCDPSEFPTAEYINTYKEAYTNANLTTWEQFGQTFPKNSFIQSC